MSGFEVKESVCWIKYNEDRTFEKSYDLIQEVIAYLAEHPIDGVVLDLTWIDMLNSSGIGLMASLYKEVNDQEKLFVVITNDYVHRTLGILGFSDIFPMVENEAEASAAFNEEES